MAHKRLRDWPVMCFSYWLKPEGELTQAVWHEAKRMNKLWNHLVAEGKKLQEAYQELYKDIPVIAELNEQLDQAKKKCEEADQALNEAKIKFRTKKGPELAPFLAEKKAAAQVRKEVSLKLKEAKASVKNSDEWENKKAALQELQGMQNTLFKQAYADFRVEGCHYGNIIDVRDRYRNSLSRAFKTKHWPKFHSFDGNFSFIHYFGNGGAPVEKIFKGTTALSIDRPLDNAYDPTLPQRQRKKLARSKARFLIGGEKVLFRTILHRPMPDGALIKKAMVIRTVNGSHERWSLNLTVEVPPENMPVIHTSNRKKGAAIDVGYRTIDDNLRIGVLVDTDGHVERIFQPMKSRPGKDGGYEIPTSFLDTNNYLQELKSLQGKELERIKEPTKKALAAVLDKIPEDHKDILQNWHMAREGRLLKIIRMLKATGIDNDLLEVLLCWRHHYNKVQAKANGTRTRMRRHRKHFYQNLALRLCEEYETIVIENLDLSQMARREKKDGTVSDLPDKARDYRTVAALSEFIDALKMMAVKAKTNIIEENPKDTTREHFGCGHINTPKNPQNLVWVCAGCGSKYDQDENAARVLLKRHFEAQCNS